MTNGPKWNGPVRNYLVGLGIILTASAVTGGFFHIAKPGHDVAMEKMEDAQGDFKELKADVKEIRTAQIEQGKMLLRIEGKLE